MDDVNIRHISNVFTRVPYKTGVCIVIAIPCAEPTTPNIVNRSWYIGSTSSRPLLEKQRSVRITDRKAKLSQLAEDPYLLTLASSVSFQNIRLIVLKSKF